MARLVPGKENPMHRLQFLKRGPVIIAAALVAALVATSFASGATSGSTLFGGKRNPGSTSQSFTSETQIIASNSTYGTRQSNKSDNGGGAIYGCRSKQGGSEKNFSPCLRASNLVDGRAFEFANLGGPEVGRITSSNVNSAPFTTNATGVATGLNADRVDGKNASDIVADAASAADERLPFAAVAANGTLSAKRGASSSERTGTGEYSVVFARDVDTCALSATQQTITDAGAVGVELQSDKRTVKVATRAGGATNTDLADRPFHLTATC